MEDSEIISLYHARNSTAIAQTSEKYGTLLYHIAHGVLENHEDSEEVVNDTYHRAWNAMPPKRPCSLQAFLCRITRNLSLDFFRKRHAEKREGILVELSELDASHNQLDDEVSHLQLVKLIEQFLDKLPEDDQVLFVKRYFFVNSLECLAQESHSTVNQISGRLYRMRQRLKAKLEGEGYTI